MWDGLPRKPLPPRLGFFALCLGAAFAGCSPSYQAVYEGNVRFEHCYALEENPQRPTPDKSACWRDWSEHYTFGQTRDRVQYAISRYVALSQMTAAPTDEAMMNAAPGETPRTTTILAPSPTERVRAAPPKVLDIMTADMLEEDGHARASWRGETARLGMGNVPTLSIDGGVPVTVRKPILPATSCTDTLRRHSTAAASPAATAWTAARKRASACAARTSSASCMRGCFK